MRYMFQGSREAPRRAPRAIRRSLASAVVGVGSLLVLLALISGCASGASGTSTAQEFTAAEQQRLTTTVTQALAGVSDQVQVVPGTHRTLQVTIMVGWTAAYPFDDVPKEQERVKSICFTAHKSLWTSGVTLADAQVIVMGPVVGEYGEQTTDAHGTAEVAASTASGLSWAALDPDSAWTHYDHVYLRSDFSFT